MKKALRVLIVALITVAFGGISFAAEKSTDKSTDKSMEKKTEVKAEKPKPTTTTGEVTSVDAKAGTLTIKGKDKEINLNVISRAKAALGKIKVGDMVKVTYTEQDGKLNASSVAGVKGTAKKSDTAMEKSKAMDKPEKKADEKKASTK
jgi:Cu/Ag efflux protein CusF